ncbi:MAG: pseudouridine synthase [Actinomycetota bacterium]
MSARRPTSGGSDDPRKRPAERPRSGGPARDGAPQRGSSGTTKPSQPTRLPPQRDQSKVKVDVHDPDGVRLQKLLAAAGVGSRRTCESLITSGRVEVDGHLVTELGVRIDPMKQTVNVDGSRIQLDESRVYLAFNKPLGVVSTMSDDLGRACVGDYVSNRKERLFHVGRLDVDTEGLLLLTNDGELAHRLQHPSYGVLKTYLAQIPGPVPRDLGKTLRAGVELPDGPVKVDSFKLVDSAPGRALVELQLHEGRKHVVRRLLEAVGHPVMTLVRTDVGPIRLGDLRSGRMRPLNQPEIGQLYSAAGL